MQQTILINKATFSSYEDLAVNIKPERITVFVKKAQELDLKIFLGSAFYYDLMKNAKLDIDLKTTDETPDKYKDLINGREYVDRNGHAIYFNGIIPALIYWTFARFIEADGVHFTATGPVIKQHDNADAVKPSDIAKLVGQQRSVANAHANDIAAFLESNKALYPLWRYNERNANSRQPGARIRGVERDLNGVDNYKSNSNGFLNGLI